MSGISLPLIPGAAPAPARVSGGSDKGGSRPGSAASGTGYFKSTGTYAGVNNVRSNFVSQPSRSYGVAKVYHHLPALKYNPGGHASRSIHKQSSKSLTNNLRARYSARHRRSPGPFSKSAADSPYLPTANPEECLKCLLRVPHRKCEAHKYIRIGGGYRHGYWYIKCLLEQLELQRQKELLKKQRLEAIKEHRVKAIKTYIRTKSGRLIEKIIFLSEEDYEAFKSGKNVEDLLKRYLTKEEADGLQSWDKDEVVAVKTYVRTKSGRLVEKLVYVSKEDYDAIKAGKLDAKEILKNYLKPEDGEQIEGWGEATMRTIKTYVRTKSGRLVEKIIMISEEDYQAMIKEGKDPNEIIKKYMTLEEGEVIDSWQSGEPMKAIKTTIRTKSGRLIEKTIFVSADDYDRMMMEMAKGGDPNSILQKYLDPQDGVIQSWEKVPEGNPMKVIKTYVRTKSGRLVEKTVMLTEDEYNEFLKTGGDTNFLKKFMDLKKGEVIENWEKASTVYSDSDDQELQQAKAGERIIGKDGTVYEVFVDPVTGKKYKKKVGDVSEMGGAGKKGRKGRGKGGDGDSDEDETAEDRDRRKQGNRNKDSDSEYSYRSVYSAGGTKHVRRRKKRADGTYSDSESYHSDQDADGAARRRRRRRERAHGPDSAHSYFSVVSAGGTRHVRRKKKRADGTYSASESYHSSDSGLEGGGLNKKKKQDRKAKKKKEHGSDSEHSYYSETSEGGTRRTMRKKRIRDADGKVIGHGKAESYVSSSDSDDSESVYTEVSDGKGGKIRIKKEKPGRGKRGKKGGGMPDFSDSSTDSEDVDLENMTEEERQKYFEEKAKRKAEREKRRREKYGDKYDEMMEAHEKKKKEKKEAEDRARRAGNNSEDEYEIDPVTGEKKMKKKNKVVSDGKYTYEYDEKGRVVKKTRIGGGDGDSGSEYEYEYDEHGNLIKERKKKGNKPGDEDKEYEYVYDKDGRLIKKIRKGKGNDDSGSEYEYEYDEHGNIIKEKKKGKKPGEADKEYEYVYDKDGKLIKKVRKGKGDDDEGSEYEYEYDKDGNLIGTKKTKGKLNSAASDDGNYFEVDEKGQIKLRPGRRKIDLNKLTDDDLRRLGIDPTLSKQEIARLLKEKFGDDIEICDDKKKIGTKRLSEYGSDVDTDDLADDSDLDITTLKGTRRVNVLMKRGGQTLLDHMKRVLDQSKLQDDTYAKDLDEKDGDIDFLSHYKLVDGKKLESYARAFVVEDEDFDTVIRSKETKQAIEGVASVNHITPKQLEYVFKVLKIDDASQVTFRMFAVISALCERVTQMDPVSKHLLEICDLLDIERKMTLYKAMFYTNVKADRDPNFIKADSLKIELIAGGLNWKQQEFIIEKLQPNIFNEISFLDYICYIPLFLSMHDNIIDNPLDMNNNKYEHMLRRPSGLPRQRDHNPLGNPLSKDSSYQNKQLARDLLENKIDISEIKAEKRDVITKYSKLPMLLLDNKEVTNVSDISRKTSTF